jgi:hypothetical protein
MAAELPAVSTPITDVKVPYGDVVAVAATPEEFIAACERQLALGEAERQAMAKRMREVVANTSWDLTASRMHELIESAVPGRHARLPANQDAGKVDVLPVRAAKVPVAKTA